MEIIKKWTSCVISFIAGVLGLVLSACSGMVTKTALGSESIQASKIITDSSLADQAKALNIADSFTVLKAFAIIMLVVSILLLVYSIVMLLKNVNVIKSANIAFEIFGVVLSILLLIAAIALMIATNGYASALHTATAKTVTASLGLYQPFMLVVSIIAVLTNGIITFINRKNA